MKTPITKAPQDLAASAPSRAAVDWDALAEEAVPTEPEENERLLELIDHDDEEEDLIGEDDDNPYQDSDEALPDDDEERTIARNPSREGNRFGGE